MSIMKAGYVLVDCTGVDLTKGSTEQSVPGLYNKIKAAEGTGKLIICENCIWGTGKPMSPIHIFTVNFGTYYVLTASTLQVYVTNADVVTIVNMVGS